MTIKRSAILSLEIVILSFLFISGIISQAWADSVKPIDNGANQDTMMKMDVNASLLQKKKGPAKEPIRQSTNRNSRSYKGISYSDYGAIIGDTKLKLNFLKAVEEKKGSPLRECLHNIIPSYCYIENVWKDRSSYFVGTAEARSSNPEYSHSHLGSYSPGNRYVEERTASATLKLLQPKKEELFREIFMGFRFSFAPLTGHIFLDLSATPSPETGTGIPIPF
jgi:hypothetical protein